MISGLEPVLAEEEAERIALEERLERFRSKREEFSASKKSDMKAVAYMKEHSEMGRMVVGEHPPGVRPSQTFSCRAELAVAGVHSQLMRGIDAVNGIATAIVLSGYYSSNDDHGSNFTYSGEGGLLNGTQVDHQDWVRGNLYLRRACDEKSPVRVVRGIFNEDGKKHYIYEGLYEVDKYRKETKDGFDVCLFEFKGVENEHKVSGTVEFNPKAYYRSVNLSTPISKSRKRKKEEQRELISYGAAGEDKTILELNLRLIEQLKSRKHVLCFDISGGKEAICVPMINEIDEEGIPSDFRYVSTLTDISSSAQYIIDNARQHWMLKGCQNDSSNVKYIDGLLQRTQPEGLRECGDRCVECGCNRVVRQGVRYPLEVFKTREKGWGIRCSVDIPKGAFVCEYLGSVISDEEANIVDDHSYLYSLDHFFLLRQQILSGTVAFDEKKLPPLPLSDEEIRKGGYNGKLVVIDAKAKGNVGRFLNHGCAETANLLSQMLLTEGCNGVFHHIAFFAIRDIPRMTELLHDYGYNSSSETKKQCFCRGVNCQGSIA